jgi:hypothetical protein
MASVSQNQYEPSSSPGHFGEAETADQCRSNSAFAISSLLTPTGTTWDSLDAKDIPQSTQWTS